MSASDRILILGNASDAHAAHMKQALELTGAQVFYWDTANFPAHMHLSWQPHSQVGKLVLECGHQLSFDSIKSVYWRQLSNIKVPPISDAHQRCIAINDSHSTLRTCLNAIPARWVNSWEAYQFHREKPRQLATVHRLGISIPDTLVSNDADVIKHFVELHPRCIFKPVYGGAHTQFVQQKHLISERMNLALQTSPITIQEYIAGTNIRSYVVGSIVFSAEIRSPNIDFRSDTDAQIHPLQLPKGIESKCLEIARQLNLLWTAIDWRLTPEGRYVFLEANPSPMFIHFEAVTKFPITRELMGLLLD